MNFNSQNYSLSPHQLHVSKPWGYEIIYTPDDSPVVGKYFFVAAGKRLSLQYHDMKVETLCLINGEAKITLGDSEGRLTEALMEKFKGYFVKPGQIHRLTAVTDVNFIESSTPETGQTFRIEDDNNRPNEDDALRKAEREKLKNDQK